MSVEEQTGVEEMTSPADLTMAGRPPLKMKVDITQAGPCRKHLKVEISAQDVEEEFGRALGDFSKTAIVPGFRPGKAPRTLVERRYRKEVSGQVKGSLLMACMEQLDKEYKLNPISQPNIDPEAIQLPERGPMTFELEIEVPPEFELPDYTGLKVKRPTLEITAEDVDRQLRLIREERAQIVPKDGAVALGDLVVAKMTVELGDRDPIEIEEFEFRVRDDLRLQDALIPGIGATLEGAKVGESRTLDLQVAPSAGVPDAGAQTGKATLTILDLKTPRLPDLDEAFAKSLGFASIGDLRDAARSALERQFEYRRNEFIRREVMDQILKQCEFDLPPDLVKRQERLTLGRRIQEMRAAGLSEAEIKAGFAELKFNAHAATTRSLQEYFILSKIAEQENFEVSEEELEQEIQAIAAASDESPRRVRARLEKEGMLETLATQIIERKALQKLLNGVSFEDVPQSRSTDVETIELALFPSPAPGQ
ncbi:trigger factor [Isosphaera pallida ATCC 43644]|uniref:Trigger factor n=1 Tax=Isosphaera pallida (strain ATCC 43644 / DSM 9630 / IS1B) TaxID=575540 RepID=E8QWS5_ISOPI|nr:trigger factor [Isosphaera pallida]ADV62975.1 trigger factor [Isosphaera pallida ATCC 43644]